MNAAKRQLRIVSSHVVVLSRADGSRPPCAIARRVLLAGRDQPSIGRDAARAGDRPEGPVRRYRERSRDGLANGDKPGAARPGDYLEFEQLLVAAGGPDVTRVHSGRSRQDIKGTIRRLFMREALLRAFERLNDARESLLNAAEAHRDAILPAYTYGVQAQPTTFGHYMGAYAEALRRKPSGTEKRGAASTSRHSAAPRSELPASRSIAPAWRSSLASMRAW